MPKTPITEDLTLLVELENVQLYEGEGNAYFVKYTEPGQAHPHTETYFSYPAAEANFFRAVKEVQA